MKKIICFCASALLLFATAITNAEVKIPVGSQTPESKQIAKPTTGMTKAQVKSQFGEPQKENPAKGKPPISNWEYTEFTVYFESDHAIHTVIKPKLHEDTEIILETVDEISEDELKTRLANP